MRLTSKKQMGGGQSQLSTTNASKHTHTHTRHKDGMKSTIEKQKRGVRRTAAPFDWENDEHRSAFDGGKEQEKQGDDVWDAWMDGCGRWETNVRNGRRRRKKG